MDMTSLKEKYKDNPSAQKVIDIESKISKALSSGENISELSSELSYYAQVANITSKIQRCIKAIEDAKEMLLKEQDAEIKEMATEEIDSNERQIPIFEEELSRVKIEREFHDTDDDRAVIMEIRAGAGGDEASLFAADLFRMYKNFGVKKGWNIEIIDSSLTQEGGYKEVIAHFSGKNVFKELKYESGVHRVQRVPVTEASGRIHTSTASVAVLPEAKEIDIQINPADLKIEVMRASGAGGQCVNRTDSAIRITHLPTGIVVSCQETKHQAQNKEKAMALLRSRLYDIKKQEEDSKRSSMRSSMIGSSMRAEKIRTYNFPQNRVTDHRIKKSWFNLESILNGNIQEIVDDVRMGIQLALLKNEE